MKARLPWLRTRRRHADERELVEALRRGDEEAYAQLVDAYGVSMIRVARTLVGTQALAEEVAQEAWLGVIRGIDRFEERSSLRTWIFRIVVNLARTRAAQESRTTAFSSLGPEPAVDPSRFFGPDHDPPRAWATPPHTWPEARLEGSETRALISRAISALPAAQRLVISLRDIEGWSAEEVCNALDLSENNQRVLLHRARSRVRGALERYLEAT